MGLSGLEPPTSRLSGVRSNQLSYKPKAPGIHLSSHTVSSIVFSAAYGLTVVFGMGTGVSRKRIDTRNLLFSSFSGTLITEQRNEMSTSDRKKIRPYACITGCFSSWLVQYSTNTELRNAVPKKCLSLTFPYFFFLRKEVIQPHLPIRLPCYDFTPVTGSTFDGSVLSVRSPASGISDSHGVTGGVYKTRERIHRGILIRDY